MQVYDSTQWEKKVVRAEEKTLCVLVDFCYHAIPSPILDWSPVLFVGLVGPPNELAFS